MPGRLRSATAVSGHHRLVRGLASGHDRPEQPSSVGDRRHTDRLQEKGERVVRQRNDSSGQNQMPAKGYSVPQLSALVAIERHRPAKFGVVAADTCRVVPSEGTGASV